MNDNDVRELLASNFAKMAGSKTVTDVEVAYFELKEILRHYKNDLEFRLKYGKETTENDN